MASITANSITYSYDDFLASTRAKYIAGMPTDSVFKTPVTWEWVQSLDSGSATASGVWIEFPVQLGSYSGSSDIVFGGMDTIDPQDAEVATVGRIKWYSKYMMVAISQDKLEANSGSEKKYDYVKGQLDNARQTQMAEFNADLWGASQSALKITSIAATISTTTTTGSVEELSRATYNLWRQTNTDLAGAPFTTSGLNGLRTLEHTIQRGPKVGKPDTIFANSTVTALWEQTTDAREWTEMATSGKGKKPIISEAPVFRGCEWLEEPVDYPNPTTLRMLNSKTWHHKTFRAEEPGKPRPPFNGLWYAYPVGRAGALWCDALRWNGLLSNFLAS